MNTLRLAVTTPGTFTPSDMEKVERVVWAALTEDEAEYHNLDSRHLHTTVEEWCLLPMEFGAMGNLPEMQQFQEKIKEIDNAALLHLYLRASEQPSLLRELGVHPTAEAEGYFIQAINFEIQARMIHYKPREVEDHLSDMDLPGMWEKADFTGGKED